MGSIGDTMNDYFGFLFARPSFLEGAARALDFGNTLQEYNTSLTPGQADSIALDMDLRVIMRDLEAAAKQFAADSSAFLRDGK